MKLSDRLENIISMVSPGRPAADVGTDHGFVPVRLVSGGIVPSAIAMDIGEGPLSRAREHIEERGLKDRIETRLSDGLAAYQRGECGTVVITGMGGELICEILKKGLAKIDDGTELLLSPHTHPEILREFLDRHGFRIRDERCVRDAGKYYFIIKAACEGCAPCVKDYRFGDVLKAGQDPVFRDYLERERNKLRAILDRLPGEAASPPENGARETRSPKGGEQERDMFLPRDGAFLPGELPRGISRRKEVEEELRHIEELLGEA